MNIFCNRISFSRTPEFRKQRSLRGALPFPKYWSICVVLALVMGGCRSREPEQDQSLIHFWRQQAIEQQQQMQGPQVVVLGSVRQSRILYTQGLTLAEAILRADYIGRSDPSMIRIIRNGQTISYPVERLLRGEDYPLQAGDIVQLLQ